MRKRKQCKGITPKKDHLGPFYLVRVSRKHPITGKELGRRLKVRDTFEVAQAVKADLIAEIEAKIGGHFTPQMTLGDYVRSWLKHRVEGLAQSTIRKYVNDLQNHILPALGNMPLNELTPSHVRAMFARDTGAPNSKMNRLRVLRAISKDAIADRLITWDFTARISIKVPDVYTEEQPNILPPATLDALLEHFDANWQDAVFLMSFTGMRWCEVAGLQWSDINLEHGVLRIRRSNVKGILGPPKTKKSRRTLGLTAEITERMRARYALMVTEKHPTLTKQGWVFPKTNGDLHRGYPMRKALERACKRAGVVIRFTTHGLRRTYNDLARRLGDATLVRATMGHETEEMTEHYSMFGIEEKRDLSEKVADEVRNRHSDRHQTSHDEGSIDPKP